MNKIVRVRINRYLYSLNPFKASVLGNGAYVIEEKALSKENDYKEMKTLYHKYLEDIANVLKKYGFINGYEVATICYLLLKSGLFSKEMTFVERTYHQKNYFIPLLGMRIMSGYGDCKNFSYFTHDFASHSSALILPLNGKVKTTDEDGKIVEEYHSANIININGKKMLYDSNGSYFFPNETGYIAETIDGDIIFTPHIFNMESAKKMLLLPNLTKEEVKELENEFLKKFRDEATRENLFKDILKIHLANKDNLTRISEIEESYSLPIGNSKTNSI